MEARDENEEIVELLKGIRTVTHHSLSNLLSLAKEAAFDGEPKKCIHLSRCALHQVEMSNTVIKTLLMNRDRPEWAILEDADNYIEEQKVEAIFCDLIKTSISISSMKGREIEA